jgi:dTDP-4-dehydrorhamnose 3,5-epimerase-like enzyme
MIIFLPNYFTKKDARGKMIGLVNEGNWKELNFFSTKPNQKRGNHYHKKTDELFIILKGKIKIELNRVSVNGKLTLDIKSVIVKKGDVFIIPKMIFHSFDIIEESNWINGLSIKMNIKAPDIFDLKE